ncbi:hypothetical protein M0805_004998 [Coniferiporia weirii]|nr:hypothetical protein M0805_004998 [Coniferiporia weirii]
MSTQRAPTATTPRRVRSSKSGSSSSNSSSDTGSASSHPGNVLKDLAGYSPVSEALSLTDEGDFEDEEEDTKPEELDEEWDFGPKPGDAVWVKSKNTERETWYFGHVQKSTRSGTVRGGKQGTFYSVRYHRNLRRYFAPLLGDIKPDTPRVRRLLEQAGCDVEL